MAGRIESHAADLSEADQLAIALALSEAELNGGTAGESSATAEEDARLAAQLQEAEFRQSHVAPLAAGSSGHFGSGHLPSSVLPPSPLGHGVSSISSQPAGGSSSRPGGSIGGSSSDPKLVDSLKEASAVAVQRIGSGASQLWKGLKKAVDQQRSGYGQQQQQQQQPYYPPSYTYVQPQQPQQPQQPPYLAPQGSAGHGGWQPPQAQQQQQQRGQPWQWQQQQQQQQHLTEDEALAQALQAQFDLEEQEQRQQQQQQQAPPPLVPNPTGPLGANLAPVVAAASGGRPAAAAPAPQRPTASPGRVLSQQPAPQAAAPAAAAAGRPGAAAAPPPGPGPMPAPAPAPVAPLPLPVDSRHCAGCGKSLSSIGGLFSGGGRSTYINALGRNWHPSCLRCAACGQPIGSGGGVEFGLREGRPYHIECQRRQFHPRCDVCSDYVPEQANRRIVWSEVPFWKQRFCPHHSEDGTPRCAACTRLRPAGEAWAEVEDSGRQLCLSCLDTITTDTRDAQPLWHNVLSFFAGLGMPLPVTPPMMLVDSSALNEAEGQETHGRGRGGGPVFHVRGLTLTEEYTQIRTMLRIPGGNPFAVRQETVHVGPTRCEVTGILVLYGLPRLLTGSILAHECMHAWLRMGGYPSLGSQVEEGLCQLMALLWLEAQQVQGFKDAYEERLAAFFANQIRTDESVIYGDGFRLAHEAFQNHGLPAVLAHVRRTGVFPS